MNKTVLLFSILFLLFLSACGSSDVKTGGSGNSIEKKSTVSTQASKQENNTKTVNASSLSLNAAGMQVGLGDIKIREDRIEVGVNLNNTTSKVLHFYPDQGHLVVGDMQLDANMFMTTGKVGGDVEGGVKQDGVIVFLSANNKKIDIKSITQIKLVFGDVTTDDFMTSQPVEFTVPVN